MSRLARTVVFAAAVLASLLRPRETHRCQSVVTARCTSGLAKLDVGSCWRRRSR